MKKIKNTKAYKALSLFTIISFFVSYSFSAPVARASQREYNTNSFMESILEVANGCSEDVMLTIINAASTLVGVEDERLFYAISELFAKAHSSHAEITQSNPCDEALLLFTNGVTWLFLSYIISQIISNGGQTCAESICINDDCLCVVDDYEESSSPIVAGTNNIIRLTVAIMIVLASLSYLQNCLGPSTTTIQG
jgi:hypothetical protein